MRHNNKRKIISSIIIISIGVVAGVIYPLLSREIDQPLKLLNGVKIGLIGSTFLVVNEIWLRRMVIRRLKFSNLILIKSIQYSAFFILLIILVISLDRSRQYEMGLWDYWHSRQFADFIWHEDFFIIVTYSLAITVMFILLYLVSRKMGHGVLWNFIIGRYHNPSSEQRIFMYLDLNNSTTIAEKLGDVKYHRFLNQFFYDITDSLVLNYGNIYRYIGDEVIVSWKMKQGLRDNNVLQAFYSAKRQVNKKKNEYAMSYGIVPEFSAAIHCGEVVVGEIGEVKSEISYLGEVLQETSAMEKACSQQQAELLVSNKLYKLIPEPDNIEINSTFSVEVKGLLKQLEVVELVER